jgi:hypothetical protein
VNEDGGALIGAMVEEGEDSRVIEIFVTDVVANLHAQMAGAHAAGEFGAGRVNILQRDLAESAQPSFAASAELERCVVKQASAIERVLRFAIVGKKNRRGGNDLLIHTVAIHLFQADIHVPARRSDFPENAIANHDHGFAGPGVLDARPIGRAKARREVRPGFREKVSVNVGDWHFIF